MARDPIFALMPFCDGELLIKVRRRMRFSPWPLLSLGLLCAVAGCLPSAAGDGPPPERPSERATNAGVFELAGRTQPAPGRIGQIAPAVLHPVIEVMVGPGDRVKTGQILVRLDDDEPRAAVRSKKAAVTEFRASLAKIKAMPREQERAESRGALESAQEATKAARVAYDRAESLHKAGAISERAYHEARSSLLQHEADERAATARLERLLRHPVALEIAEMEARILNAEAELAASEAELEHYTVLAPIDGIVSWLEVKPGTVSRPGTSLWGEILDLSDIEVRCDLTPEQADDVTVGQVVEVVQERRHPTRRGGLVVMVGIAADPRTGRVPVNVRLTGNRGWLRCNTEVKVRFGSAPTAVGLAK
jgi:HlyD family secretion protein